MSVFPVLDAHTGHHRAPAPARRRFTLTALFRFLRRSPARQAEEERAAPVPPTGAALPPEVHVRAEWEQMRREHPEAPLPELRQCCPTATGEAHTGLCAWDPGLPPESYPYPEALPDRLTMIMRRLGDGLIVLAPDGCIQVRVSDTAPHRADNTLYDLPAVPRGRYVDEMPGGTE